MEDLKAALNNETRFNELAQIGFDSTDTNKNGIIEVSELENAMGDIAAALGIPAPSKQEVSNVVKALDSNHDGKVDFNEFKVFVRRVFEALIELEDK
jgi:Ca2+-binding EF-hand superfamily protein